MILVLAAICGYLIGSLSLAIIISRKVYGSDIRSKGSGNTGATNMARVFGLKAGVATLVFDVAKASAAMLLGKALSGSVGLSVGGVAAVLGHCFPVFHSFKGGKAVAVGLAVIFAASLKAGLIAVAAFALMFFLSRKVSLSSVTAALLAAAAVFVFKCPPEYIAMTVFTAAAVIIRHRANIVRLIHGEEPDFSLPSGKKNPS